MSLNCIERKDAEGWETVQRGRPVRPRSTAAMPRASLVTETLRSKDDSDKENVCLLPGERTPKGDLIEDRPSVAEPLSKDSPHSSDRPLAERTQVMCSESPHCCFRGQLCVVGCLILSTSLFIFKIESLREV